MEDKQTLKFEGHEENQIAKMIVDIAIWQAKCGKVGATSEDLKLTPDLIREGANMTFLVMDLIQEWKTR